MARVEELQRALEEHQALVQEKEVDRSGDALERTQEVIANSPDLTKTEALQMELIARLTDNIEQMDQRLDAVTTMVMRVGIDVADLQERFLA